MRRPTRIKRSFSSNSSDSELTRQRPFWFRSGMAIETLGEARDLGWITARCAWGTLEAMKSIRECVYRAELDTSTRSSGPVGAPVRCRAWKPGASSRVPDHHEYLTHAVPV
jgi:hypothetical protein